MMFYLIGLVATFIYLTQDGKDKPEGQKELIFALCISLVWPVLATCLLFYYKEELGYSLANLLGFLAQIEAKEDYDEWVPPTQNLEPEEDYFTR